MKFLPAGEGDIVGWPLNTQNVIFRENSRNTQVHFR